MLYVGLDIHIKHISICVLDENGKLDGRWRVRAIDQMLEVLGKLPGRFAVCYEVSCGYGHFHDLLTLLAVRVAAADHVSAGTDREKDPREERPAGATENQLAKTTGTVSTLRSRVGSRPHPESQHGTSRRRAHRMGATEFCLVALRVVG